MAQRGGSRAEPVPEWTTWSTTWNFGPNWEIPLLNAYGVAPDPDRTGYYRLLYDLGP